MSWDALLTRARDRRDRIEGPAPAHDLVVSAIMLRICNIMLTDDDSVIPLVPLMDRALDLSLMAEECAATSGALIDRQIADQALTFAIDVARRIVETMETRTNQEQGV